MIFLPAWMADLDSTKYTSPIQIYAPKSIYLAPVIQIYLDRFQSFYPHFFWNNILIFERWNQNPLSHLVQDLWNLILVVFTALFVYVIKDLVQYPCFETTLLTLDHFKFQPPLTMIHSDVLKKKKSNNMNIFEYQDLLPVHFRISAFWNQQSS